MELSLFCKLFMENTDKKLSNLVLHLELQIWFWLFGLVCCRLISRLHQWIDKVLGAWPGQCVKTWHPHSGVKLISLHLPGWKAAWIQWLDFNPAWFDLFWRRINTLRPKQNGRRFADDTLKRIFLNENMWISINISPKFVPEGSINNIPALVQIIAWCRPGDRPLSEAMMVRLPTHICVTGPQWVKWN